MTIKNIRQFNAILSTVANVEQHYTDLLTFAVDNIHRHGNKDPILSFLNAPFLRTKAGKIKKAYIPLIRWMQVACPALYIGEREYADDGSVLDSKHTAHSMPTKIEAFNIFFDKKKEVTVQPFTEWLNEQAQDKEPSSPATTVTAKTMLTYLESKLALSLTANDQTELDSLVNAAKALIIAAGKATLPAVDGQRVAELAKTKASAAEKRASKANKKTA